MSLSKDEMLIGYLDNTLDTEERANAERFIRENAAAAQELEELLFSVELIRENAVLEKVKAVRKEFSETATVIPFQKKETGAVVRSFSKNMMRIAAVVLLLLVSASVYKYSITNTSSVYDKNYTSYELETSRGTNNDGGLEKSYRNKNWTAVENEFNGQKEKTSKSWFLNGMAEMELKNFDKAIVSFNSVVNMNKVSADPYYEDEAEYYLALSYLAARQPAAGIAILQKIRGDKDHLFYKKALAISAVDLKVLQLKN